MHAGSLLRRGRPQQGCQHIQCALHQHRAVGFWGLDDVHQCWDGPLLHQMSLMSQWLPCKPDTRVVKQHWIA